MKLACAAASPMHVFRAAAYRDELEVALGRVDDLAKRHDVLASELAAVRVLSRTPSATDVVVPLPLHRFALTSRATFALTMVGDFVVLAFLCCATREPTDAWTVFAFGWCARLPGVALLILDLALTSRCRATYMPPLRTGDRGHAVRRRSDGAPSLLEEAIVDGKDDGSSDGAASLFEQTMDGATEGGECNRAAAFDRSSSTELFAGDSERGSDTDVELADPEPEAKGACAWPCESSSVDPVPSDGDSEGVVSHRLSIADDAIAIAMGNRA